MAIGEEPPPTTTVVTDYCISTSNAAPEKRHRSVFELPTNFFDFSRVLPSPHFSVPSNYGTISENYSLETLDEPDIATDDKRSPNVVLASRLTCNTCEVEFQSLKDQRSHFKSDIHRFNVKLCLAGKKIVKEDDVDELTSDSFKDCDVSSISGSEDEAEKEINSRKGPAENVKQKLFVRLQNGLRVSVWRCLVVNESDNISFEDEKTGTFDNVGNVSCLRENEVVNRFKNLIQEPRDNTHLRIVLLASGGHFAGCVFDGNSVVAHKTFHRYVVRAKAGKKQSSKDASGKTVHSAGAALRRYNEQALRKEIQELLISWKPYFDASAYVFLHAPSSNRLLIFNGEKPCFSHQHCVVRNVPMIVRRPTLKEAHRIYDMLTQISYEVDEERINLCNKEDSLANEVINCNINAVKEKLVDDKNSRENSEACPSVKSLDEITSESETEVIRLSTPLHEAAKSGDAPKILELLEHGLDPCIKDERGRTPYMLASEKEVRNAFRKFMALNLDKWDWHAAKVPSALTKELEESQAAKQAEKAAKKKAREKELKKLRKEKQKKAQAQAAVSQNASRVAQVRGGTSSSQSGSASKISKEEELKREREKRAAAAERRIAAATNVNSQGNNTVITPSSSQSKSGIAGDINCSCCNASLAGKVPFHRYNYKYCSTSCMHVHREILEDG